MYIPLKVSTVSSAGQLVVSSPSFGTKVNNSQSVLAPGTDGYIVRPNFEKTVEIVTLCGLGLEAFVQWTLTFTDYEDLLAGIHQNCHRALVDPHKFGGFAPASDVGEGNVHLAVQLHSGGLDNPPVEHSKEPNGSGSAREYCHHGDLSFPFANISIFNEYPKHSINSQVSVDSFHPVEKPISNGIDPSFKLIFRATSGGLHLGTCVVPICNEHLDITPVLPVTLVFAEVWANTITHPEQAHCGTAVNGSGGRVKDSKVTNDHTDSQSDKKGQVVDVTKKSPSGKEGTYNLNGDPIVVSGSTHNSPQSHGADGGEESSLQSRSHSDKGVSFNGTVWKTGAKESIEKPVVRFLSSHSTNQRGSQAGDGDLNRKGQNNLIEITRESGGQPIDFDITSRIRQHRIERGHSQVDNAGFYLSSLKHQLSEHQQLSRH